MTKQERSNSTGPASRDGITYPRRHLESRGRGKNVPYWILILMVQCMALASCGDSQPPAFTSPPQITPNPHASVPLVAFLESTTDEPSRLSLMVTDGDEERLLVVGPDLANRHRLPILGLEAGKSHTLVVRAIDEAGNETREQLLPYATPPLPDDFPPLSLRSSQPDRMEPGVTLFEVRRMKTEGTPELYLFAAVNAVGEVIWYYRPDDKIRYMQVLSNGHLLYLARYHLALEIDLTGNILHQWHARRFPNGGEPLDVPATSIPVDAETFHHEIYPMPSGNLLVLSTELKEVDNFPVDLENPGAGVESARLVGDVVVEFQPDGTVVNQWSLLDLIDPGRYGYSSGGAYWQTRGYGHIKGGTRDWSHANSVFYDAGDDAILVSVRHHDAVIKFSRATGELIWILGTPEGWGEPWRPFLLQPAGELEWPSHQHAARLVSPGLLLLYDNGNHRSWPPQPKPPPGESYSRVVEFQIDEERMMVNQGWSYGGPGPDAFFSSLVSEADRLPLTGNVLITDGGRSRDEQGHFAMNQQATRYSARIFEIPHTEMPEVVFDLVIEDPSPDRPLRWSVYRSQRLPSLYVD